MSLGVLLSLQFFLFFFFFFFLTVSEGWVLGEHASPLSQIAKNLPVMRETLGWEDPLEKGMATHSSIIAQIKVLSFL